MPKRRIILYPHSIANDVEDVARMHGWKLARTIPRKDDQFYEEVWEAENGGAVVRFIDDHFVEVGYVSIAGDAAEAAEQKLRSSMRTLSASEVMKTARRGKPGDRALAIRSLAATTLEPDGEAMFEVIDAAADDDEQSVRLAAIKAIARLGSKKYWPVVERRNDAEQSKELRPEVDALVDAFQHHGKSS